MSGDLDLVAEHANLLAERVILQKACMDGWLTMSHQVAKRRQDRLWAIRDRLLVIERSESWRRRTG